LDNVNRPNTQGGHARLSVRSWRTRGGWRGGSVSVSYLNVAARRNVWLPSHSDRSYPGSIVACALPVKGSVSPRAVLYMFRMDDTLVSLPVKLRLSALVQTTSSLPLYLRNMGSLSGQTMWDLWWTKWHLDSSSTSYFRSQYYFTIAFYKYILLLYTL
jgi:hypothetical protein